MLETKPKEELVHTGPRGNKFNRTDAWYDRHDFDACGSYMGNIHTGVFHEFGCRDIDAMNEEHKVETNNDKGLYRPCGHCKPGMSRFLNLDTFKEDEPMGAKVCEDPAINRIFSKTGCLNCSSKDGIVKMYPHSDGVRLLGEDGKWWIYLECYSCGYDSALYKAKRRLGEL